MNEELLKPYYQAGRLEAGLDEAGRGCLAGPVVAAAVILPEDIDLPALNDSKKLKEAEREALVPLIKTKALAWAIGRVEAEEIDEINILQASFLAMHRALDALKLKPEFLLVDGNRFKAYPGIGHRCEVKGDGRFASIAAASILAKSQRDAWMRAYHLQYPQYDWAKNMGYPTPRHRQGIVEHGTSPLHRRSFRLLPLQNQLFTEE